MPGILLIGANTALLTALQAAAELQAARVELE
jgi:hypothetical protein